MDVHNVDDYKLLATYVDCSMWMITYGLQHMTEHIWMIATWMTTHVVNTMQSILGLVCWEPLPQRLHPRSMVRSRVDVLRIGLGVGLPALGFGLPESQLHCGVLHMAMLLTCCLQTSTNNGDLSSWITTNTRSCVLTFMNTFKC